MLGTKAERSPAKVLGEKFARSRTGGKGLPFTGAPIVTMLAVAAIFVVAGAWLGLTYQPRRRGLHQG